MPTNKELKEEERLKEIERLANLKKSDGERRWNNDKLTTTEKSIRDSARK